MKTSVRLGIAAAALVCFSVASFFCSRGVQSPLRAPASHTFRIGKVRRDRVVVCRFPLDNNLQACAADLQVVCGCGCMRHSNSETPENEPAIFIRYSSGRELGSVRKKCLVKLNGSVVSELVVEGQVVPEVRLRPETLEFAIGDNSAATQILRIDRVGLPPAEFLTLDVQCSNDAIRIEETVRDSDHLVMTCIAEASSPHDIAKGIDVYWRGNRDEARSGIHVRCKYSGPRIVPSIAVFSQSARRVGESRTFRVKGIKELREIVVDTRLPPNSLAISFSRGAGNELPTFTIECLRKVGITNTTYMIDVFYIPVRGGETQRKLSLPIRFI